MAIEVTAAVDLGGLALGSFGLDVLEQPTLYESALGVITHPGAFVGVDELMQATCVDDRLGSDGVRLALPHLPGGGMTLSLFWHLLYGEKRIFPFLHADCLAMRLGVPMVREVLFQPQGERMLLRQLGIDDRTDGVLLPLQEWALNYLPESFFEGMEHHETLVGDHTSIAFLINHQHPYYTLRQEVIPAVASGYGAFSADQWAVALIADTLTSDAFMKQCVEALGNLLIAGTARRAGSRHLRVLGV